MPLLIVRDAEFFCEFWLDLGGLFGNALDHGATRAAFDDGAKAREIFAREDNLVWPWLIDLYQGLLLFHEGRYFEAKRLIS